MTREKADKPYHHGELREALVAAGRTLLEEKGLRGFTLRECARRASVSHAAPAHHFASIDDLLAEIAQGRAAASAEPPADADLPPLDPTPVAPPAHDSADSQAVIHTNPLFQSSPQSEAHLPDLNGAVIESNSDTQGA